MTINSSDERIWTTVNSIPEGKVSSYGQVADFAGLPGRARLVGKCLGRLPKNRLVSWHRVLRSNGQLAFDKGSQQALLQSRLLQQEGVQVSNNRVNMKIYNWHPDLATMLQELKF